MVVLIAAGALSVGRFCRRVVSLELPGKRARCGSERGRRVGVRSSYRVASIWLNGSNFGQPTTLTGRECDMS